MTQNVVRSYVCVLLAWCMCDFASMLARPIVLSQPMTRHQDHFYMSHLNDEQLHIKYTHVRVVLRCLQRLCMNHTESSIASARATRVAITLSQSH